MRIPLTVTIFAVLLWFPDLYAQKSSITDYLAEYERKYGRDEDLVNGEKYFYPYRNSQGDPFFFPEPRKAVITVHNKEFPDQLLRYDIFNQQLILDFKDIYGANSSLVLRQEWVESFAFEQQRFVRLAGPDGKEGYYQMIWDGPITCIYRWSKNHQLNLTSGEQNYYFTEPARESYLVKEGRYYPYRNNRTFLKTFDPALQKTIKQFMKQSKVKVNRGTDAQIRHLLEYCNALVHEDS